MDAESALVVPLIFRGRPYGVLVAVDHLDPGDFSIDHQRLLEAFAASAATAVATAQEVADEQRRLRLAIAEAERAKWARELHDETLQALGSLRLILSAANRTGGEAAMHQGIDQALSQLEVDIATLRGLITELRPAALDQLGLEPAVVALIDRVRNRGLEIDLHVDLAFENGRAADRLMSELETGLYRIIQEALTNATKHGDAHRAVVELIETERAVTVVVRDDGSGFDPHSATAGFGLLGMRERVELLGGELQMESSPGHGATVTVSLPARHRGAEPPTIPQAHPAAAPGARSA